MKKMTGKSEFRKECLEQAKGLSGQHNVYSIDKKIVHNLYCYLKESRVKEVMLYVPLVLEVDISSLIYRLRREKVKLYVPFMEGKSFRLVEYRLPLNQKKFGIQEPNCSKKFRKKSIDMAIVPVVGVDCAYRRIGFGKGMYDRFFQKNKKNIKQIVFVTRKLCYSKEIVTEYYDVQADKILSSHKKQRIIRCWR